MCNITIFSGFFVDMSLLNGWHEKLESDERYAIFTRSRNGCRGAYVLTNYHVIRPAACVFAEIEFSNGDTGMITHVIAEDEKLDLALLLVSLPTSLAANGIPLAPSDPPILTTVYAIGSPEGLSGTASEGKVSAYREIYGNDHWLQTTAPISHGSSGGPLLLADGTLVGVTTLTHNEGQNLNFAIPVSAIQRFLSTGPFHPRDLAEGANILWHEYLAIKDLRNVAESAEYSDAQKQAARQASDPDNVNVAVSQRLGPHD
jgi:S1-C subfamily serine protease